jgi:hypothetical protein
MKIFLRLIALLALLGTIIPSFAVFYGLIDIDECKSSMLVSAVLWFLAGFFLMKQTTEEEEKHLS